jgi:hypothetical protein
MPKMPYSYVSKELDKLYEKQFPVSDVEAINKHCEFIGDFIRACGWTEDELIEMTMGFKPDISKLN